MAFLLQNVSADTTTVTPLLLSGGDYTLSVYATNFGGGAVSFTVSPNGDAGTFIPLAQGVGVGVPVSLDANSAILFPSTAQGHFIKATLSGSTGASGVNVQLDR